MQIAGVEHTLVCHTRDISADGCFLDTSEVVAEGVALTLSVMDNARGEVVQVRGRVARSVRGDQNGIGVRLAAPPPEWQAMVERYEGARGDHSPISTRLTILVVGDASNRRGALALYVTSGWDVRFAEDLASAREALAGVPLDAVIAEIPVADSRWSEILTAAKESQPGARRLVRAPLQGAELPTSGRGELVQRFVEAEAGMDAVVDALTADLGS